MKILIMVVYVDDILIFHNDIEGKEHIINLLKAKFEIKELSHVLNVLGVRVQRFKKSGMICLDPMKILKKLKLLDSNPVTTPLDVVFIK